MNLNVKEGDKVIIHGSGWNRKVYIAEVEKITPAGFIKVNGTLYHPYGSQRTSDAWNAGWIEECTPEKEVQVIQTTTIRKVIRQMQAIQELTYEQAVQISEILERKAE